MAIDDATRVADVEVLPDEQEEQVVGVLERALAFFAARGVSVERVMTDNGPGDVSALHALACRRLGIRHLRTRPYRPRTNGKAERFIDTLTSKWAHGRIHRDSRERQMALPGWIDFDNRDRPHSSLGGQAPDERLRALTMNNVAVMHA